MEKFIFILCIFGFAISFVKCQQFCNIVPITPEVPKPTIDNNAKFQSNIEKNSNNVRQTEELIEYYDGAANIGISAQVLGQLTFFTYSYYAINEFILYNPLLRECKVYALNDTNTIQNLSPFPVVGVNGTTHILSPLNSLFNNPVLNFAYTGQSQIRGIDVNQWQACTTYNSKSYKFTVSFSNPDKWKPASFNKFPNGTKTFEAVPVEINILTRDDTNGANSTETYTFTEFKPFLDIEVEDYTTPSGVYCPGRRNLKPLPDLPDSFQFATQNIDTNPLLPGGNISTLFEEYSFRFNLYRYSYSKDNVFTTEIHDFNTGLKYKIYEESGVCETSTINQFEDQISAETSGSDIKLKDPSDFFSFDNKTFQWIGFRRRDGVLCDVWIGPKNISGQTSYYEWYFMAQSWNRTDLSDLPVINSISDYRIPIYLKVFINFKLPGIEQVIQVEKRFHIVNFKQTHYNPNFFDISRCDCSRKDHLTFTLSVDDNLLNTIRVNLDSFNQHASRFLADFARVTTLRVSKLETFINPTSKHLHVVFTLFEKASFYGSVPEPQNDYNSFKAIQILNDTFLNGKMLIEFYSYTDRDYTIYSVNVVKNSLRRITSDDYDGGLYLSKYNFKSLRSTDFELKTEYVGYKSGTVAGVTILMIVVGIAIGVGVTILEKQRKIQILSKWIS